MSDELLNYHCQPDSARTTKPQSEVEPPAAGSASPATDDAWESYNRQACGLHYVAHKMRELEQTARELMRACYDEANRLANHGSNGLEKLVMSQLYAAANDAKKKLNKESHQPRQSEV